MNKRDDIYSQLPPDQTPPPFAFDETVARVFPDMIRRSVPGYAAILHGIGLITRRFARPGSTCYDLGCSTGAATLELRRNILVPNAKILAVDTSEAMVARTRAAVAADASACPVEVRVSDVRDLDFEPASVIVMNFTLQFVPEADRPALLQKFRAALVPDGIFVLSEKTRAEDDGEEAFLRSLHEDFKRAEGYSDLEIAAKRQALENVLVPWTPSRIRAELAAAGFAAATEWFNWYRFRAFAAFPDGFPG